MTGRLRARRLAPLLVALTVGTSACEAVVGTSDLREGVVAADAGDAGDDDADPFGGDDDDDASSDASPDAADGSTLTDGAPRDGGGDGGSDAGDGFSGDGGGSEGGTVSAHPSCGVTNSTANQCGPNGTDDCCATAEVTGAMYYRVFDAGTGAQSAPVTVSSYDLDVYEVTVGRMRAYAAWLATSAGKAPADGSGIHTHLNGGAGLEAVDEFGQMFESYETGWDDSNDTYLTLGTSASNSFATTSCTTTYTSAASSADDRPMNCVGWYDAYAFCIWDGGFLPTEAEWELAAVAGAQQLTYPWGTAALDRQHATYGCSSESPSCPTPVGTAASGIGFYKQYDLIGNVAEWTLDDFVSNYEDTLGCTDCVELTGGSAAKVDRGGAYTDLASGAYLSPQDRSSVSNGQAFDLVGFRCARAPK